MRTYDLDFSAEVLSDGLELYKLFRMHIISPSLSIYVQNA